MERGCVQRSKSLCPYEIGRHVLETQPEDWRIQIPEPEGSAMMGQVHSEQPECECEMQPECDRCRRHTCQPAHCRREAEVHCRATPQSTCGTFQTGLFQIRIKTPSTPSFPSFHPCLLASFSVAPNSPFLYVLLQTSCPNSLVNIALDRPNTSANATSVRHLKTLLFHVVLIVREPGPRFCLEKLCFT